MKKFLFVFFALCVVSLSALDYADKNNWVICENGASPESCFDVFYVYPTLVANPEVALMDCNDPQVRRKTLNFTRAQAGLWGKSARIFSPYVRQLEYARVLKAVGGNWESSEIRRGVDDTREAFRYYLEHYNHGRPFILFGHSQGAMDLYCLLKNEKEISAENGLVAAYLIGLPKVTHHKFDADFAGRSVKSADDAGTPGVVVVWNTQNAEAKESIFTAPDVLCINPLNWQTDETAAPASENRGAVLYDYRDNTTRQIPFFCGAKIDLSKGALIVDLPSQSTYDSNAMMGKGIFHGNDIWFFAGNLRENALLRLKFWNELKKK